MSYINYFDGFLACFLIDVRDWQGFNSLAHHRKHSMPLLSQPRPKSSIPFLTGLMGLVGLMAATLIFRTDPLNIGQDWSGLVTLSVCALCMILTEILLTHLSKDYVIDEKLSKITIKTLKNGLNLDFYIKLYGLSLVFLVLFCVYKGAHIYQGDEYAFFFHIIDKIAPYFLILGIIYIWITHALLPAPHDTLWHFGRFFLPGGKSRTDAEKVKQQAICWLIKGFFLPLMFSYYFDGWHYLSNKADWMGGVKTLSVRNSFDDILNLFYYIDTGFITIGYAMALRLLNTHIRYPETRAAAWMVTLICYAPFHTIMYSYYISYNDGYFWGHWLNDSPVAYTIWGMCILLCLGVYTWASVCAGIRFSNLNNRGIITFGPYAVFKHPAYFSKNLSWWLIDIPFIATSPLLALKNSIMLALLSSIYYMRGRYEETMLSADPLYAEYLNYIRTTGGIIPRIKRLITRLKAI
jgi:protein-S-isoprenylcysteine O-methyltransferase Ste14